MHTGRYIGKTSDNIETNVDSIFIRIIYLETP